jgi:hypothetical protein
MLLQSSSKGGIRLLPLLPKEWLVSTVTGLWSRGGFDVDLT